MLLLLAFASACAGTPKVSQERVTQERAGKWLKQYCSQGTRELAGDLLVKSSTQEFKGQFPASLHFEKDGKFLLEVTNILGGTLMRLSSDSKAFNVEVPSKPKLNQKGLTHYLGLEVPVLSQLFLGDLPCPEVGVKRDVKVFENEIRIMTSQWTWIFYQASESEGFVPVRVVLTPTSQEVGHHLKIELLIEAWDRELGFAKKVSVHSPEGELRWIWKNRK